MNQFLMVVSTPRQISLLWKTLITICLKIWQMSNKKMLLHNNLSTNSRCTYKMKEYRTSNTQCWLQQVRIDAKWHYSLYLKFTTRTNLTLQFTSTMRCKVRHLTLLGSLKNNSWCQKSKSHIWATLIISKYKFPWYSLQKCQQ
jgi:hypothetical protein